MNFQVVSLAEFLAHDNNELDDGFASASEYVRERAPPEQIHHPSIYDDRFIQSTESSKLRIGEITQLLQNTPGTIGHVDKFPETSVIHETNDDTPDIILTEKIPIFLGRKYFEFQHPQDDDESAESSDQEGTKLVNTFSTVFADDENNNGKGKESDTSDGKHTKSKHSKKKYFNAFEVYQQKRVSRPRFLFFFYIDIEYSLLYKKSNDPLVEHKKTTAHINVLYSFA